MLKKLMCSVLLFRVWNHLFYCERSQYCLHMCVDCTILYIPNKKISDHINKNLYMSIEQFHPTIKKGIAIAEKIYFFPHSNGFINKDDPFTRSQNVGVLYYESISSPFLLFKMSLDTMCKIVFNISSKHLLFVLLSSVKGNCRSFTACTGANCPHLKSKTIKAIFYKRLVEFSLYLVRVSCKNVCPSFIHNVFNSYKRGRDFLSYYLEFDRDE